MFNVESNKFLNLTKMIFLKIVNATKRLLGAVAQLGERLDGIQKVVGSIPSSSTNYKILCLIFFSLITKNVFAETVESYKLLIPGETFRNDNQKKMRLTIIWLRVYHMSNGDKKNAIKKHLLFSKIQNYAHMILICVLRIML